MQLQPPFQSLADAQLPGRTFRSVGTHGRHWLRQSVDSVTGYRELSVLDRLTLCLDPRSYRCTWYWRQSGADQAYPMRLQPDLLAPLLDPTVMALFGDLLLQRSATYDRLRMPTMVACRNALQAHLSEAPLMRAWKREWYRALLASQPQILQLSEQTRLDPCAALSPALYALVWRHEQLFLDVFRHEQKLCPLLGLLLASGWTIEKNSDVLKSLRTTICGLPGCGPATWRWLIRHGIRPMRPLISALAPGGEADRAWAVLANHLSLWSQARLPPPLPEQVTREWAARIPSMQRLESCCPDRLAVVARYIAHLSAVELSEQVCEIVDVLQQASEALPPMDRNQRRAGWSWLRVERRRAAVVLPADAATVERIRESLPAVLSLSGFNVVVLNNRQAIAEEGQRMAHCMASSPSDFLMDGLLHFSIRRRRSAHSVATCSLALGQLGPVLVDIRGRGNQSVGPALSRVAARLARHPQILEALRAGSRHEWVSEESPAPTESPRGIAGLVLQRP